MNESFTKKEKEKNEKKKEDIEMEKEKLEKVMRNIANVTFSLGEKLSKKSRLSKERAQIIRELKVIEKKISDETIQLCSLEKKKTELLN